MALAHAPSRLDVHLFGEPRFYADGALRTVSVPPKAVLLLCVLALKADQPLDRTKLAYTLWPDDAEDEAKGKLRRHLHLLGRAIAIDDAPPQILATNTTITWKSSGACSIDVVEFEQLSRSDDRYESAVPLYAGELLPNFYEEWLEAPRRRLREVQLQNLLKLAEQYAARGEFPKTLEYARAALRIDPWREDAVRFALAARTHLGDRSGAMQEYAQFVTRLREEFDAEPLPETKQIFDAIKVAEPASNNLPLETTRFIGRQTQLQALNDMLKTSRLVTMTGPGGVGKSRTALHCARELFSSFDDGVWLVEAGAECNADQLVHTIASTLGFQDLAQNEPQRSLLQFLRTRHALLLFDNVEGFVDACAELCTAILESCERVSVFVTSREPLQIAGEAILRLSPFEEPGDAVELFNDRARAADASFSAAAHRSTVDEICRRVDLLPLAIELAAARVATLTPAEILERLHDRFSLLKRARVPEVRHHQTLHATIGWSHELLSVEEQTLFRRLAIFAGAFTMRASEQVCADERLSSSAVLDTLSRLVDKSLVTAILASDGRRYRFLDSIREYALAQLDNSGDAAALRDRYLAYYSELAQRSAGDLTGARQSVTLQILQEELDNIRTALQFGDLDAKYAAAAFEIACEMHQFWLVRGHFHEGRQWVERALGAADGTLSLKQRARGLSVAALLASFDGDREAAANLEQTALQLRTQAGDEAGIARSIHSLGYYAFEISDFEKAKQLFADALSRAREIGDDEVAAKALDNLGLCATALGDFDAARASLGESLALYRRYEDAYGTAWVLSHLAWLAERTGDYQRSLEIHQDALALREQLGDRHGVAGTALAMTRCYEAIGNRESARETRTRSITAYRELHNTIWLAEVYENYGYAEARSGAPKRAATLLGIAQRMRSDCRKQLPAYEQGEREDILCNLEKTLGTTQLATLMQTGAEMSLDEAVSFATTP